jgi:glycine dehydrogenase subunit 1
MYMRKHIGLMIPSIKLTAPPVFNEFVIELPVNAEECVTRMASWHGFAAGIPIGENRLLIAVTEKRTKSEIDFYIRCLEDAVSRE